MAKYSVSQTRNNVTALGLLRMKVYKEAQEIVNYYF